MTRREFGTGGFSLILDKGRLFFLEQNTSATSHLAYSYSRAYQIQISSLEKGRKGEGKEDGSGRLLWVLHREGGQWLPFQSGRVQDKESLCVNNWSLLSSMMGFILMSVSTAICSQSPDIPECCSQSSKVLKSTIPKWCGPLVPWNHKAVAHKVCSNRGKDQLIVPGTEGLWKVFQKRFHFLAYRALLRTRKNTTTSWQCVRTEHTIPVFSGLGYWLHFDQCYLSCALLVTLSYQTGRQTWVFHQALNSWWVRINELSINLLRLPCPPKLLLGPMRAFPSRMDAANRVLHGYQKVAPV